MSMNQKGTRRSSTATQVCPLCGEEAGLSPVPVFTYLGSVYTFCCPACRERFARMPEKYITLLAHESDYSLDYPCPLAGN